MTAVPVVRTFVAGEVVLASYFNTNINGPISWLLARAILEVRSGATQTIATATFTSITYDTEDVDSDGMHSTVTNTSRATAVHPGWYRFSGGNTWASNATGRRGYRGMVNGAVINGTSVLMPATLAAAVGPAYRTKLYFLNVTDYFEFQAFQDSGGNLATLNSAADQSSMTGVWESN
jgi:hypothetical protein